MGFFGSRRASSRVYGGLIGHGNALSEQEKDVPGREAPMARSLSTLEQPGKAASQSSPPIVIGGIGGSGTRVVVSLLQAAGIFMGRLAGPAGLRAFVRCAQPSHARVLPAGMQLEQHPRMDSRGMVVPDGGLTLGRPRRSRRKVPRSDPTNAERPSEENLNGGKDPTAPKFFKALASHSDSRRSGLGQHRCGCPYGWPSRHGDN